MPEAAAQGVPGDPETLADLGEWRLIDRLARFAPPRQFDDDGALIACAGDEPGQELVVSTDVLVDGVHFSDPTTAAADVGWRAAMANLSDLAAMGCPSALGLTVGLVAPPSTPWSWVEGVYEGLSQALGTSGGVVLGGDCSSGPVRMLAITALGRLPRSAEGGPIRRRDGRPGDLLLASGPHGLSRLGLALLCNEAIPGLDRLEPGERLALETEAIRAHRRPRGRFDVVQALAGCRPASVPWRLAGADSSDGLLAAVTAIARASGCGAALSRRQLPLAAAMATLEQGLDWCLGGGEDFELVLALEPAWAQALLARLPGVHLVGTLTGNDAPEGLHWLEDGCAIATPCTGFSHFLNASTGRQRA